MRLLWLCNSLLPEIASKISHKMGRPESWLIGIYEEIKQNPEITLNYLYPGDIQKKSVTFGNATFIPFAMEHKPVVSKEQVNHFCEILIDYRPDVIHIFGTEFSHTCAMIMAAEQEGYLDRTVISIQGLVSVYSKHYNAYLPHNVTNQRTLRDWIKRDSIMKQQHLFAQKGILEERALSKIRHVIGRTDWDRACVERLNPDVIYHHCNENLRDAFYKNQWTYDNCEKYSIFLSQWYSPLKGLHLVLEAMADLIKRYPEVHLYTTGEFELQGSFWSRIRYSNYKKYCAKLIHENGLDGHVTFLGMLNEQEMCDRFLKSNVFVCSSSVENSPNSVGEAMIMGVPTVSSDVGGVKNMLKHEKDGFIYPPDAPYMLAYYVKWFFDNPDKLAEFSINSRQHAMKTHNRTENMRKLFEIYREIEWGACQEKV